MAPVTLDRIPFTPIDEAVLGLDTAAEPWTIQVELRVAGRLDEARLRNALRQALDRHAMARARLHPDERDGRRHLWEIAAEPGIDPLRASTASGDDELARIRSELYSEVIPLSEAPPLRARLVHHPDGDLLLLSVSHVAFDGFGALRLLHSAARAYTGRPDPPPAVELPAARDLDALLGAEEPEDSKRRLARLGDKVRDVVSPPAHLTGDQYRGTPGYGFHHVSLSPEQTADLLERDGPGTVNDVLVGTLHLAVDRWNTLDDIGGDWVSVLVPVNVRPKLWERDVVTNLVLESRVATSARDRKSWPSTLEAVMAESDRIKAGGAAALMEVLPTLSALPPAIKDRLSGLLSLIGDRLVDSAVLSNLGHVGDPPSFGPEAGHVNEIWFSAPARMPCGLSIGAASVGGRLHLAFRYRRALWGPQAAAAFAEQYVWDLVAHSHNEKGSPVTPIDDDLDEAIARRVDELVRRALAEHEERNLDHADPLTRSLLHGKAERLHVDPTAVVNNALFNTSSGDITVGPNAIFGHNVSVLTGTHDVRKFGEERKQAIPREGRDVVIGEGAWLASNVTVLGPCRIGEHAVVGACALVQGDVEPYAFVAGVPAKEIRKLEKPGNDANGDAG